MSEKVHKPVTSADAEEGPTQLPVDFAPLESSSPEQQLHTSVSEHQRASIEVTRAFDRAVAASESGNEESAVQEYLHAAAAAEAANEWHMTALACERVGDFLIHPKPPSDLERALRMYRRAAAAYENCGLFSDSRRLFYRVMLFRMRRGNEVRIPVLHRAELFMYWLTAGFGYRPLRVIGAALGVVLIYGLLYWSVAGGIDVETRKATGFIDSVYFSGITFATVGYGDVIPAKHARLLALSEGMLGAFFMGFFVVVLSHRLTRT